MQIKSNIPEVVERRGWRTEDLASKANISHKSAGKLMRGEVGMAVNTLCKVAGALEVQPGDLIEIVGVQ